MSKCIAASLLMVLLFTVWIGAADLSEKEARLARVQGKKRLRLLVELTGDYMRMKPEKAITYGMEAIQLFRDFPDPMQEVGLYNHLGIAYREMTIIDKSRQYFQQARQLAKNSKYKKGYADSARNLGLVYRYEGSYIKALENLSEALRIYRELGEELEIGNIFNYIGVTYMIMGDFKKALENLFNAKRIYVLLGAKDRIGSAYNNISLVYIEQKNYENALIYLKKALKIAKEIDHKRGTAIVLDTIATVYYRQGKYNEAIEYARQSLEISVSIESKINVVETLILMGKAYSDWQKNQSALDHFNRALTAAKEMNERKMTSEILINIGKVIRDQGDLRESLAYFKEAQTIAAEINENTRLKEAHLQMSNTYAALNDFSNALNHYKKYKELNDAIFNEANSKRIAELETRFALLNKEKEIILLKKDKENQENLKNFLLIISLLVLLLAFVTYTRYRLKVRSNLALRQEIDNHKQTDRKLKESEEKFRTLAEKSVVGIYIIQDNVFKYVNPRFSALFDYTEDEIIGMDSLQIAAPEDRSMKSENIRQLLMGSVDAVRYEFRGITREKELIHLESFAAQTLYQDQPAIIGTLIDITGRKKAEAELLKSQRMEAVGILAGGIAHDFNNLLSIIVGYISILKDNIHLDQKTLGMVEKMEQASQQATDLANKLITFSKGGWIFTQTLNVTDILKDISGVYPDMKPLLQQVSIPADLKPIHGDKRQLREVISSLLKNAVEAADSPEKLTNILIKGENITLDKKNAFSLKKGDYVKISVIDKGKGIPPDHMDNIFDPYFSTKDTVTQKGMGMGLAICYSIIKKHNGYIRIQSQMGEGTTVELFLPTDAERVKNEAS